MWSRLFVQEMIISVFVFDITVEIVEIVNSGPAIIANVLRKSVVLGDLKWIDRQIRLEKYR
jgi:hypothetical protein